MKTYDANHHVGDLNGQRRRLRRLEGHFACSWLFRFMGLMAFAVLLPHPIWAVTPRSQSVLCLFDVFISLWDMFHTLFEDQRNLGNSACESSLEVHSAHGLCKVSQKSCIKEACLILFNLVVPQLAVPPLSHPHPSAPNTHTVCLTYVWAHTWAQWGTVWAKPPPH